MQANSALYDVAVIGAGPAGAAAAYFLAAGGLHVALLDKSDFPRDKTCGDGLTPRAIALLDEMGVLPDLQQKAYHCSAVTLRQSDDVTFRLELSGLNGLPHNILVLPRFSLDDILRQRAVTAGADFKATARVKSLLRTPEGIARLQIEDGQTLDCKLVIMATGANSTLLRGLGLLKKSPPVQLAARTYFENVDGLDDTICLFFDGVERPGYGWVFPTGPGTANVGCGAFFDSPTPQPSQLRLLIQKHPYLQKVLKNAQQVGPIKGFPLRTDFSPAHCGNEWILVVGEAVGLVNPITGEGIDYALESAHLAAQAILGQGHHGSDSMALQKQYRAALAKKFRRQFMFSHLMQKVYFRNGVLDNLLRRADQKQNIRQAILDTCFGSGNLAMMFTPRILWDVFGP